MLMTLERWQRVCDTLQIACEENEFQKLLQAWSESQRVYHTQQHLQECLQHVDYFAAQLSDEEVAIIEIALWYHDAIYQLSAKDNERQSANWAISYLQKAGGRLEVLEDVERLIMVTCHDALPKGKLQQVIVDIDLAILGASSERFNEYGEQVRQEYAHVPKLIYRYKRKSILKGFLQRDKIFQTNVFNSCYENQARTNLKKEIASL
ncbi:MAG: N-methyl-D-aspartate receptor NMDAR2C subunit [uncultured Thiotrichaceae bacterium]|uniref:N-methyl-D-aspartate receptor NMDAR2C subunit n=1 Tax=uncultured Thiotrichaceae bacterium TaxID=298394 RepID=A0A6S6TJP0_9GAMM|nr:MAG: N-methyl-D-aspartate receptor NMDAR2C subunit [uncultured Thiotrichaceae bacterium]